MSTKNRQTRQIHPEIRVLDAAAGLVEYVASDETLDHYREIIRADGWRFNYFQKNAPFVDSHDYGTIDKLLGTVVDFRVEGRRLIETVKWAHDVEENRLARIGFAMTQAGHLKAVSVGFIPTKWVDKWTNNGADLGKVAMEMGLPADQAAAVRTIFLEQEQIELSACIIGANPAALARAYKAGVLADDDLDTLSRAASAPKLSADNEETAREADQAAAAARAEEQRQEWLRKFEKSINGEI
jgi:hypothetical protein